MTVNTSRLVREHGPDELAALDVDIAKATEKLRALLAQYTAVRAHMAMAQALTLATETPRS